MPKTLMLDAEESGSFAVRTDEWARIFEFERSALSLWLTVFPEDIEHIGSTAVPGLAAGAALDIMIGVEVFPPPANFLRRIARLGYVPVRRPAVPDQFEFSMQGPPKIELHVVEKGANHWTNNIALRDFLKTNAAAREGFQWPRQADTTPAPAPAATLSGMTAVTEMTGE